MSILKRLLLSVGGGLALGAGIAWLIPQGEFWVGWLAGALLLSISLFCLISIWRWAGAGKTLAWIIFLTFFLRLGTGIFLRLALPLWGNDEPAQNSGYAFYDAMRRDGEAWNLAHSEESIWNYTKVEFYTDQYGGLLSLIATIYRYLSPDAQRTHLVLILAALISALGVIFLWQAVRHRWNMRLATLAVWIYALYPDAILYSSAQMREPFMIGLGAISFWAVLSWNTQRRWTAIVFFTSMAAMGLISSRVAIAIFAFLVIWFLLERMGPLPSRYRVVGWVVLVLVGLVLVLGSWAWLSSSSQWDLVLTERDSGWVVKVIEEIGEEWRIPFIVLYGTARPVLPAAIAEPSVALWKTIGILRSAGWYALAPLIMYALFAVWKVQPVRERRLLLWLAGFLFAWVLVSSARAGGDMWDNPRYRVSMLPWLSLLAAWSIQWAIDHRDAWLPRWLLVEVIFLGFFTNWYFSRYFRTMKRLFFWENVAWILGLSAAVLLSSWLWKLGGNIAAHLKKRSPP